MKFDRATPPILDEKLTAAVPAEVRRAVERVANAQRVTPAEFVRKAVIERLDLFDVPHEAPISARPRGRR